MYYDESNCLVITPDDGEIYHILLYGIDKETAEKRDKFLKHIEETTKIIYNNGVTHINVDDLDLSDLFNNS